jgi:hypothetical protein
MINRSVLSQVGSDSGSLTSSTTIAHRFAEAGEYRGLLHIRGKEVREFTISVVMGQAAATGAAMETASQLTSVDVNLRRMHMPTLAAGDDDATHFELEAGGYAVFRVPAGAVGGYAVEVHKEGGTKVFDSRELKEGDLFAAVMLRPGTYSVTNAIDGAKGELTVAYPDKIPKQLDPVKAKFTAGAVVPAKIRVHPMQGLVFGFETPSRVKIELVAPEDRPPRARVPRHTAPSGTRKKVTRLLKMIPSGSNPA